jgi:tetratricopeptide (TPR) repeat protein
MIAYPKSKLSDQAQYRIGLIYLKGEQYDLAVREFRRLIEKFPQSTLKVDASFGEATANYNLGRYQEAIDIYRHIADKYKEDEVAYKSIYQLGWCYYKMGKIPQAIDVFNNLAQNSKQIRLQIEAKLWLGDYYYSKGELDKAKTYFYDIIKQEPKADAAAESHYWLSNIFLSEGDVRLALEELNTVYTGYSTNYLAPQALIDEAGIYLNQNKNDEAINKAQQLLNAYSQSPLVNAAYDKIAIAYKQKKDFTKALEYYKQALQESNNDFNARIQYEIANCYESLGELDTALSDYMKVIYKYSSSAFWVAEARLKAGLIFETKGELEKAALMYEKVIELNEEHKEQAVLALEQLKKP